MTLATISYYFDNFIDFLLSIRRIMSTFALEMKQNVFFFWWWRNSSLKKS